MPRKQTNIPPFFDRRVIAHGYTRLISLGKVIPSEWRYVRIYVIHKSENEIQLVIRKLLGADVNASPPKVSVRS